MGAGCSNGRALAVQDSVTKKQISITSEGRDHLRNISSQLNTSKDGFAQYNQVSGRAQDQSNYANKDTSELNNSRMSVMDRKLPSPTHGLLWDAVETNDIKAVEQLLEKISSEQMSLSEADLYDSTGSSMAHKAASLGHAEVLMLLLERSGAKPDIPNGQLASPLHLACKNNRESVAKFLIGCGVDINGQDENGQTPLLICCIHGNIDIAQIIIEASQAGTTPEPLEIDQRDHRGLTSLNCAAIKGDLELSKLLIEKGGAKVDEASPKGCTPSIYAARGGYDELLKYLILVQKASPLKQDNSGATLFHHAIEKGNIKVLKMLLQIGGGDITSGIEIADNAGRTPIFEAVDNDASPELMRLIIKKRVKKSATESGLGSKVNVLNYNGQTPLFSAVREGNMELIRILIEEGEADSDMNGGEMIKDDSEEGMAMQEEEYESEHEKYFVEAYKNCMTPLQLACILGQDDIAMYLIERGQANPNLQTNIKGYACLHLSVLANKPEMVIELLTRTNSNPNLPDYSGRTLLDMVEKYIPSYLDNFTSLLENLQVERLKRADNDGAQQLLVATHYYNPDDDREIKGFKDPSKDLEKQIEELQQQEQQRIGTDPDESNIIGDAGPTNKGTGQKRFLEMDDSEIEVEEGKTYEREIDNVFGRKIALGLIASNFKLKEMAMKMIMKNAEKQLSPSSNSDSSYNFVEFVRACTVAVDLTCKEKVIKVFNLCLSLLTLLITSARVEQNPQAIEVFKRVFTERSITLKLLQRSEEGNTRITNKIHECLLDYSFHPRIGEAHVSSFILQRINQHNKQGQTAGGQAKLQHQQTQQDQSRNQGESGALGSYKGLLAQLALLYKFVNSFGVSAKKRGPLNSVDIVNAILPSLSHSSQDVRSASSKILLDVQRFSGAVKEEKLASLPDKIRQGLIEKLKAQVVEKDQNQAIKKSGQAAGYDSMAEQSQDDLNSARDSARNRGDDVEQADDGTNSQNWTGPKKDSLQAVQDFLESSSSKKLSDEFLTNATVLLKSGLEDNNMNMYLQALEVANLLFAKGLFTEIVIGSLTSLIKPIILRTTDTNTRIRKRSVEVMIQIWTQQPPNSTAQQKNNGDGVRLDSVPQIIADVICDLTLQERAIVGRLGLLIKRCSMIESSVDQDLCKKPHQIILGRNYEELIQFASQWALHKNTKVRQNGHKLVAEICRVNSIDSRGGPFKQRIVNMIIQLRPSIRDPLIQKINEACLASADSDQVGAYIDPNELELNLATKQSAAKRAMSMDVHKQRAGLASRQGTQNSILPDISGTAQKNRPRETNSGNQLPNLGSGAVSLSAAQPSQVLPHAEPLTDELKKKGESLIELFGPELVTCFYSQQWAARFAAIEKVDEQLHNLDPNRRDAMSCEINRKNLPVENVYKIFLEFIEEGSKDPVLKNLIAIFDLLKKALPTFFRYLQPSMIKKDLMPVVSDLIKKTSDLKAKIREVAIEFCLYLSHQSPIGPEVMVNQVLTELELVLTEAAPTATTSQNVAANMGNSHMISSCFKLLAQFQQQSKILDKSLKTFPAQQGFFNRFISLINASLRHQNPQVRKEGEALFKILYQEFGEKLDKELSNQKAQVITKLLLEAKADSGISSSQGAQQQEYNLQRAQTMIRTEMLNQSSLTQILKGCDEHFQALKLPNPKKRLAAVVELKKAVQKELVQVQSHPQVARNLFEPLSMLIRQLLADEEPDIYMETLSMLRAVVGALVPQMSTLDVHLMLGSFIGVIVSNTVSGNIRTQMASDKVIIFFAKHSNIGPFVVAKDILKNIEKTIKAVQVIQKKEEQLACIQDKKPTILRFLAILQLLLQHFSIVLCYQPEFYEKCIEIVADSMIILAQEDQSIKNLCVQLIVSLQKIDSKLLEQAIQKMDFTRKTPLRKAMIELEHQARAGKNVLHQDHHAFAQNGATGPSIPSAGATSGSQGGMVPASPMNLNRGATINDTRGSNFTQSSRGSMFSPGTTLRGASPGMPEAQGTATKDWTRKSIENNVYPAPYQPSNIMNSTSGSNSFKNPEGRAMRRMISIENENPRISQTFSNTPIADGSASNGFSALQNQARASLKQFNTFASPTEIMGTITPGGGKKELFLPEIQQSRVNQGQMAQQALGANKIAATGGAGFNSNATSSGPGLKGAINGASQNQNENNGGIRPPLYVPQKRDGGRAATGMLNGTGIQGLSNTATMINPPLNRTGPLPASYQPLGSSSDIASPGTQQQQQLPSSQVPQFKTEFNSNLYSGITSVASTSGTSSNMGGPLGGGRSNSMQKKPQITPIMGQSTLFKPTPPQQATIVFETNVTRYKDPALIGSSATKGIGEFN